MRSSTWIVKGGKRERDIYIGPRQGMNGHKLSLHQSGKWRLAEAEESRFDVDDGVDRVKVRYVPLPPVATGWQFATQVLIPTSSLREPFPEKVPSDRRPI